MKSVFVSLFTLALASTAMALPSKKIASCKLTDRGLNGNSGTLEIFHADNGDEGFLRFEYSVRYPSGGYADHGGINESGSFTDNIQDDKPITEVKGEHLYVPTEGTKGEQKITAIDLKNDGKKLTGLLAFPFTQLNVSCVIVR